MITPEPPAGKWVLNEKSLVSFHYLFITSITYLYLFIYFFDYFKIFTTEAKWNKSTEYKVVIPNTAKSSTGEPIYNIDNKSAAFYVRTASIRIAESYPSKFSLFLLFNCINTIFSMSSITNFFVQVQTLLLQLIASCSSDSIKRLTPRLFFLKSSW